MYLLAGHYFALFNYTRPIQIEGSIRQNQVFHKINKTMYTSELRIWQHLKVCPQSNQFIPWGIGLYLTKNRSCWSLYTTVWLYHVTVLQLGLLLGWNDEILLGTNVNSLGVAFHFSLSWIAIYTKGWIN